MYPYNFPTPLDNDVFETSPKMIRTVTLTSPDFRVDATDVVQVYFNDDDGKSFLIIFVQHITHELIHADPLVTLQNSSYMLNESSTEDVIEICVVLEGPPGGLGPGESFDIIFSKLSSTASKNDCSSSQSF